MSKGVDFSGLGAEAGRGARLAIAVSRFNAGITEALLQGCLRALEEHGVADTDIRVVRVPGSFELPWTAKRLAASGDCEAVIALGCLIRGETAHFDHIAQAASTGLMQAGLETGVPVIFGLLTAYDEEQARARIDKGYEAGLAALEMTLLRRGL